MVGWDLLYPLWKREVFSVVNLSHYIIIMGLHLHSFILFNTCFLNMCFLHGYPVTFINTLLQQKEKNIYR